MNTFTDEFGVRHINIFFNRESNIFYRLLEAPEMEVIKRYYENLK